MCLYVPGLPGRGKERQQNAAEYPENKINLFFCFQEPMCVVSICCNPLKVNANFALEEFLHLGGKLNSKDQLAQ